MPENANDDVVVNLKVISTGIAESVDAIKNLGNSFTALRDEMKGLMAIQKQSLEIQEAEQKAWKNAAKTDKEVVESTQAKTKAIQQDTSAIKRNATEAERAAAAWKEVSADRYTDLRGKRPGENVWTGLDRAGQVGFRSIVENMMPKMSEGHMVNKTLSQMTDNIKKFNAAARGRQTGGEKQNDKEYGRHDDAGTAAIGDHAEILYWRDFILILERMSS